MGILKYDKKEYFVLSFSNETKVLQCERILKQNNYIAKIISIPRKLSSGCGMAIIAKIVDKDNIIKLLNDNDLVYINIINMEEL